MDREALAHQEEALKDSEENTWQWLTVRGQPVSMSSMQVLAVIPARGQSVGVPHKNTRSLLGRPMMAYTLDAIRESALITRTVVSTEDREIAEVARALDVEVIDRPMELADQKVAPTMAVRHAVQSLEKEGWKPDIVIELYASTPIRPAGCLDALVEALVSTKAHHSCCIAPVEHCHPVWMVRQASDGRIRKAFSDEIEMDRRDLQPYHYITGTAFAVWRDVLIDGYDPAVPYSYFGTDWVGVQYPADETVDIDTMEDLAWAEFLLRRRKEHPTDPLKPAIHPKQPAVFLAPPHAERSVA